MSHALDQVEYLSFLSTARTGYKQITLYREGAQKTEKVHRLVLLAFVGPPPEGHESCHWDDNPLNNKLTNLSWGTRKMNTADRTRRGTQRNDNLRRR